MKKLALIFLLILGMTLSFSAIALVMLFANGVITTMDGARELIMGELPGGDSSLLKTGEVIQVQDALLQLQQQKQELEGDKLKLREDLASLQTVRDSLSGEIRNAATQVQAVNQNEAQQREKGLEQAAALYSALKPADAAAILDVTSDDKMVLDILLRLKDRQAARILNALQDPNRKARLTTALVEGKTVP
jgi:flagellar motility protein MotE (MotC chaperone)